MKFLKLASAAIVLTLSTNVNAALVTAYDNFNYDDDRLYGSSGAWVGEGGYQNDSITLIGSTFTSSVTGTLNLFEVALYSSAHTPTANNVTWSLHLSDGSSTDLSNQIWSQSYQDQVNQSSTSIFSVINGPELQADQEYWLIADVPTDGSTFFSFRKNSTGALGRLQYLYEWDRPDYYNISTQSSVDTSVYAMSITVDAEVSPVPVPTAIWLFGSGLIGLVGFARRKKS